MPRTITIAAITLATTALNDLHGLVPTKDRKHAESYVRVLAEALCGYARALDFQREVENKLAFTQRDQAYVLERMNEAATS